MLDRESIRPNKLFWVQKRNSKDRPTVAWLTGELPSLTIKVLDSALYPSCSDYEFIAEAEYNELWDATFKGTTLAELQAAESQS